MTNLSPIDQFLLDAYREAERARIDDAYAEDKKDLRSQYEAIGRQGKVVTGAMVEDDYAELDRANTEAHRKLDEAVALIRNMIPSPLPAVAAAKVSIGVDRKDDRPFWEDEVDMPCSLRTIAATLCCDGRRTANGYELGAYKLKTPQGRNFSTVFSEMKKTRWAAWLSRWLYKPRRGVYGLRLQPMNRQKTDKIPTKLCLDHE